MRLWRGLWDVARVLLEHIVLAEVGSLPPARSEPVGPAATPADDPDLARRAAQAIVNVFETGSVLGDYARTTVLPGDTGHLSYGRSQVTLTSGNLYRLVRRYVEIPGAEMAGMLAPYLGRLERADLSLDHDVYFCNLLRAAADDRLMREAQDDFFDEKYWIPAARTAHALGFAEPLSRAVLYDSRVHGSWGRMRERTNRQHGRPNRLGERAWIEAYIAVRRDWLAGHSRKILRATVYRMDAFRSLIDRGDWDLALPFSVRGATVSHATLGALPRGVYDGPPVRSRALAFKRPIQKGRDVRLLQLALSSPEPKGPGLKVLADALFGNRTQDAVRRFQQAHGLPPSGVVDDGVFDALRL